jgi:RNA polymerase sigma-70 factor (ECF subfamily)
MPKSNSPEIAISDIEQLFLDAIPLIPPVVRQACQSLNHHPNPLEFDGFVSRIVMLLLDNDFHTLRSFDNRSELQTWLFMIAKRLILRRLKAQKRELPLEDLPPDSFTTQPVQKEKLIWEEEEKLLQAAIGKLTERERKLLDLILQGVEAEEIAKEMGIKKESVYAKKSALIKKLKRLFNAV